MGADGGGETTLGSAIEYAQRADSLIYSIWFHKKWPLWKLVGGPVPVRAVAAAQAKEKADLQRLSGETGGRFFEVTTDRSIESIYRQIEEELRNLYSFGYTSDHHGNDKHYRKVNLTTKRPGLSVQTRAGYYPR